MTEAEKTKSEAAKEPGTSEVSAGPPKPRTKPKPKTTAKTTKKTEPKAKKTVTGKEEKEKNDLLVKFTLKVAKEEVEEEFNKALTQYAAEIKLPGFRRGKIPVEVIKTRYKEAIREEAISKVIEKAVLEKIEADKMKIISQPTVKKIDFEEGKDVEAEIEVEVFPTVEIPYLETLEVKIPAADLQSEDYDEQEQINLVLEAHKRQAPAKREIKDGDYVRLKYQSKILSTKRMTPKKDTYLAVKENEPFEILDLYKEMIGKRIGDSLTVRRSYPGDYNKKPWAGKEIEHYITIENVFEIVKPELDKDFLKSIGFEDEESFKKKLQEEYEQMNRRQIEDKKLTHIIDMLCETIVFPLPRGMVEHEVSRMAEQRLQRQPLDFKDENQVREYLDSLKPEAEKSLRFSFIVEAVKEKFNLEVSSDDLEKQYKSIAEENNAPLKEVRKFYMNKENARDLKDTLARKKVLDLIKGKVTVKEV
ncbi:MAG: trigger factor [Candidatus Aminicenantes bacterium]|nr:MAG: trigger factor [Candidatus Aminicenantes bacterium]